MSVSPIAPLLAGLAVAAGCASDARAAPTSWVGTYSLPASADSEALSVQLGGRTATVALGPGHSGRTTVPVTRRDGRIRFAFPGSPAPVVFEGRIRGQTLLGRVMQGRLHGSFRLSPGRSRILPLLGLYRGTDGGGVAVVKAEGLPAWLVELPSGAVHGIGPSLTVGERLGDTSGNGSIRVVARGIAWNGRQFERVALRQREIRVGADAATLTLPPGPGPFPAVAMVHGSGPQTREEFQVFAAHCELLGIAVLADDKRGVGQSTGSYPGEAATERTLDVLARDAEAEVRYLAGLPQIDPKRVGLLGDSQAGWIIALAAAREPAVRWAVPLVGPTTTVQETDVWGGLAGKEASPPSGSAAELLGRVRAIGPGGFDPMPYLSRLTIPVFWVFGDDDRNVPTALCVERLEQLRPGHDYSWTVLHMTHALLELPTGLYSSLPASHGFAEGLYPAVGAWLRSRGVVS
jgi:pimeloyl-ACP methyl ester carboxylesterase